MTYSLPDFPTHAVPTSSNFLDPVALQRAEMLGLDARQIVEGYMVGAHKSPYRGFAIEFAQHREYVPGDDTRHLDWKVLGKSDRYYIKQYELEMNYVAHLLLDGSESMRYGSGKLTKFDYARTMTACLAYLILLQRDTVSLGIFDDDLRATYKRTNNLSSIHEIMHLLAEFEPSAKTQLPAVLTRLAQTIKRKGIVIVISDFLDDEEAVMRGIQHLRFAGSEVIMMQVLDPYRDHVSFRGAGGVSRAGGGWKSRDAAFGYPGELSGGVW